LRVLLSQYFNNSISREDCEELLKYMDEENNAHVSRLINEYFEDTIDIKPFDENQKDDIFSRITHDIQKHQGAELSPSNKSLSFTLRTWYRAAAVLVLALSVGFLIYKNSGTDSLEEQMLADIENDIELPNSNSALLTLSDGRTILI